MGTSQSRKPNTSKEISDTDVLNEEKCFLFIFQLESDKVITNEDYEALHNMEKEICSHIRQIKEAIENHIYKTEDIKRAQILIYRFEFTLAKVRSICDKISQNKTNNDTLQKNKAFEDSIPSTIWDDFNMSELNASFEDNNERSKENDIYISKDAVSSGQPNKIENNTKLRDTFERDAETDYIDEPTYENRMDFELTSVNGQSARSTHTRLMKEVPNYYARLKEILEKDNIESDDIAIVLSIRRNAKEVKNVFKTTVDEIFKRYEETTGKNKLF